MKLSATHKTNSRKQTAMNDASSSNSILTRSSRFIRFIILILLIIVSVNVFLSLLRKHATKSNKVNIKSTTTAATTVKTTATKTLDDFDQVVLKNRNVHLPHTASHVLSKNIIIMPSSQDANTLTIIKKVIVMAIHIPSQYQKVRNMATCLQNYMRHSIGNDSVLPYVYGVTLHHEMERDIEDWRYTSFVRFPVNEQITKSLNAFNETRFKSNVNTGDDELAHYWKEQIIADVSKKFENRFVKIVNTDPLDLKAIAEYLFLPDSCYSENPPDDITIERKTFAVIIPFIDKQVANVHEQLTRWSKFHPVETPFIYGNRVNLVFYYHTNRTVAVEDGLFGVIGTKQKDGTFVLKPEFQCFSPVITFRYSQLTPEEDKYPVCANHMFYRMMHDELHFLNYRYFFFKEPDTFAIRGDWLNRVIYLAYTKSKINDFWVMGSVYRGDVSFRKDGRNDGDPRGGDLMTLSSNIHVNGNALYATVQAFRDYLKIVEANVALFPYDTAVMHYIFEYGWKTAREYWHHFQYSDYIMNLWKTDWTETDVLWYSPYTYLVHGKQHNPNRIILDESDEDEMIRLLEDAPGIENED
jgi:hypothetical protein